jgi:hypothetical protein
MYLKTLEVQMEPVGDEVALTFDVTFEVQDENELRAGWLLPVTIVGYGQKWITLQGYPHPVPDVKQHSFVVEQRMGITDSTFVRPGGDGRHIFRARVKKSDILVENYDQYIFECYLHPVNPISDSNAKRAVVVQDID